MGEDQSQTMGAQLSDPSPDFSLSTKLTTGGGEFSSLEPNSLPGGIIFPPQANLTTGGLEKFSTLSAQFMPLSNFCRGPSNFTDTYLLGGLYSRAPSSQLLWGGPSLWPSRPDRIAAPGERTKNNQKQAYTSTG